LLLVSITNTGSVFVWAYMIAQNWDVYAPGFRMLLQNEEYVESETEFDINPKEGENDCREADEPSSVRCMRVLACLLNIACRVYLLGQL
jgi:hypothetical protein